MILFSQEEMQLSSNYYLGSSYVLCLADLIYLLYNKTPYSFTVQSNGEAIMLQVPHTTECTREENFAIAKIWFPVLALSKLGVVIDFMSMNNE